MTAMPDHSGLPEMLRLVADALGTKAALALAQEMGGEECSIPASAEGSNLAKRVGLAVAEILCENYSGQQYIPNWKDREAAVRRHTVLNNPGLSTNELVRKTGLSVRHIRRIRAERVNDDTPNFLGTLLGE